MSDNLSYEQIVIDRIKIPKGRKADERVVKQLMESIKKIGLLEPIILCRPARSMGVYLVAGFNRVEAFKRLKIKAIPARVEEGDTPEVRQWRELAEIDENLIRRDLSLAQKTKLLASRKKIYEQQNPDAPRGRGGARTKPTTVGFRHDTAAKTGLKPGTIDTYVTIGDKLGGDVLDRVSGTSLDNKRELDALAKMDKDEREERIARAVRGEDVTARTPEPTPGLSKALAAYRALNPAGQKAFMTELGLKSTLAM